MGLEKINDFKKIKGLTNRKIAEMTGISISSLDKITSGENTNPKLETVRLICKAVGCTLGDLIDDPASPNTSTPEETHLIKKYRALDSYGQSTVNLIINAELKRCTEQGTIKKVRSFRAARSSDNHEPEIVEMEDLSVYPESDIEGL